MLLNEGQDNDRDEAVSQSLDVTRVVVVGAGHSGGAFVLALRKLGFRGAIDLVGDETELPYERPSLSKDMLTGGNSAQPVLLADSGRWLECCSLHLDTSATRIDLARRHVHLASDGVLPYDVLILATGAVVRQLPLPPHPRIQTLRSSADARAIRAMAAQSRSVAIVGGGVIGLEVAASLRTNGLAVDVIESGPRLMGRNAPAGPASWIAALHRDQGVAVHLGASLKEVSVDTGPIGLLLSDGRSLTSDFVVVGIGVAPCVSLAEAAGLPCNDGVLVNRDYTSVADPSVVVIGDAAARVGQDGGQPVRQETWAHAQTSAQAAARAILGLEPEPEDVPWFWTTQYGRTLQIAGQLDNGDDVISRGDGCELYIRGGAVAGVACLDRPRDFAAARRLIGAKSVIDPCRAADMAIDLRKVAA